jgi:predicted nuclease of restriction endonuclease-like RecB superfamily
MLFSLSNLKRRSVRDPDGELAVVPKLLHGRTALRLIEQAVEVFEGYVGRPRSEYDTRALEAVMGDYRLGRCIEACLLTRYSFVQPGMDSVLSPQQIGGLDERGLASPSAVRFAAWDRANERYGGFVPPEERDALLASLAEEWGLPADASLLDRLMALDSDGAAVLTATGDRPTPREIMRQYNRGAVQTLLAHSTQVRVEAGRLPGTALKRLYFVAKRNGVLVDIEQDGAGGFALALYGPEQAFGAADKYGRRLADVTLSLLRALAQEAPGTEAQATAHLLLHDRPYRFHVTPEIMQRLEYAAPPAEAAKGRVAEVRAVYSVGAAVAPAEEAFPEEPSFDSMVEARLYREFHSLERQGYTHGWAMQREPEPVLAPGVVLIPDFAFTRGDTRVFMEIAGFWSPTYRERKVAKLRTLAAHGERDPLVLAVPNDAAALFAGLPFPVVPYKTRVAATDLLNLLDSGYGSREERMEAGLSQAAALQAAARERGLVPEDEVARTLQAYTRTELLAASRSLDGEGVAYVAGVGLLSDEAAARAREAVDDALDAAPGQRLDLPDAEAAAARALGVAKVDAESLLQLWPDLAVQRPSLFEAFVVRAGN